MGDREVVDTMILSSVVCVFYTRLPVLKTSKPSVLPSGCR